ncbi:response regulator [Maribacter sp. 2304DJ31-5]|uniref:response regulator n=1 Tax=Maribacter sp. 2304DJ31-5 TaxID=3386273 RepID=UPI0039BCC0F9
MFKKVLLVEDLDTVGYGISMMLQQDLGITEVVLAQYCDDAYLKFRSALQKNSPFDLLITDLSFQRDHRLPKIESGKSLIKKLREKNQELPIIICSVEEKPDMIKRFIKVNHVSAYVLKGRDGLKDLKNAVRAVFEGKKFLSNKIERLTHGKNPFEIEEYDVSLLLYLSNGLTQDQISSLFNIKGVSPNSLSSIEKRLNKLKDILQANNNVQLVANAKDLGLI